MVDRPSEFGQTASCPGHTLLEPKERHAHDRCLERVKAYDVHAGRASQYHAGGDCEQSRGNGDECSASLKYNSPIPCSMMPTDLVPDPVRLCLLSRHHLVNLSDVLRDNTDNVEEGMRWKTAFRKCRWFSRGWTLQELIAPASVEFFSKGGQLLGSKRSFSANSL
jgi:hypothetical protein